MSDIFNCCIYLAAADFTWTHCASCLFNTTWFKYMLLLIGLTFLTHPPNKRKHISNPVSRKHVVKPGNVSLNVPLLSFYTFVSFFIHKTTTKGWQCQCHLQHSRHGWKKLQESVSNNKVSLRQVMSLDGHLWNASRASKCSSYHFVWGNIKFSKTVH